MNKKKLIYMIPLLMFFISAIPSYSQVNKYDPNHENIFQFDTLSTVETKPDEFLIGLRYMYNISSLSSTPSMEEKSVSCPVNFELSFIYYHPLWGFLDYFGFRTGIAYQTQGFKTEYNIDNFAQQITTIEIPMMTDIKVNIGSHFRLYVSGGAFVGYRMTTDRENFDCFDRRYDYGLLGGGGFGVIFKPIELQFNVTYQFSYSQLYDPEKFSSNSWFYNYPSQLLFGIGIYYHFK